MKYKILALDLDGTLTNSQKIITPRTKAALMEAQRQGLRLALASGRPTEGIRPLAEELEMARWGGFILSFNGAQVLELGSGKILYQKVLDLDRVPTIYRLAQKYQVGVLTYKDGAVLTETPDDPYIELECRVNKMPFRAVPSFTEAVTEPVPKCLMTGEGSHMAEIEGPIREALPGLSVYRSEAFFIEIMPEHIDKAYSLEQLLKSQNLTREELAACGDGFNDISMIRYASLGVAMANAVPAAKEAADFVTASNDEDGVALAVEKFF